MDIFHTAPYKIYVSILENLPALLRIPLIVTCVCRGLSYVANSAELGICAQGHKIRCRAERGHLMKTRPDTFVFDAMGGSAAG